MALTQEQLDFFSQNGYLSYGKILEDAEIELYRREYDREFARAREENTYNNLTIQHGSSQEEKDSAPQHMWQLMQMCERNIHFRRLLYDARFLDVVEALIGPNIVLFHDQALFKPARTGGVVTWHQDNAYWHCRPANLVSCWLTLDDAERENGAMQVIPGSHLKPVWHEPTDGPSVLVEIQDQTDIDKAVVINLPAGGCMFHHCQTLHYTQPNETDRQRRAFVMHYMSPGTHTQHDYKIGFAHPMLRSRMV